MISLINILPHKKKGLTRSLAGASPKDT